jgi:hypothetical protein
MVFSCCAARQRFPAHPGLTIKRQDIKINNNALFIMLFYSAIHFLAQVRRSGLQKPNSGLAF